MDIPLVAAKDIYRALGLRTTSCRNVDVHWLRLFLFASDLSLSCIYSKLSELLVQALKTTLVILNPLPFKFSLEALPSSILPIFCCLGRFTVVIHYMFKKRGVDIRRPLAL